MALARELATVFILTIFAAAPVWAADNPEGYYIKNEQKLEQDVEGEGFVMVYQKVNTESLQLKNYLHGSGTMDAAFLISSNQSSSGGTCTQDQNTLAYIKLGRIVTHMLEMYRSWSRTRWSYSPRGDGLRDGILR